MGLRISTEPLTVSEQEEAAQLAEQRKSKAELDFSVICEDKKRVQSEHDSIIVDIESNKIILEDIKSKINNDKQKVIEIETIISQKASELDILTGKKEELSKQIEDIKVQITEQKNKSENDRIAIIEEYNKIKQELEQEIEGIKLSKVAVIQEMNDLKSILDSKTLELNSVKGDIESKELSLNSLINKKNELEIFINKNSSIIEEQNTIISENTNKISEQEVTIQNKISEISSLDINIGNKKEEYKQLEKQAFILVSREDTLNQREEYIKSQYERAGINYQ